MKKLMMLTMCVLASGAAMAEPVEFRDYDANTGTFTNAVRECTLVTSETRTLENGWYAVMDEVVIPKWERLVVQGDAHLVLCDGATLRIPAADTGLAAILLSGKNSLTIYGQSLGSGSLEAVGGGVDSGVGDSRTDPGAGIGGDSNLSGGMVTINGGTVTARSGRKVLSDSIDSIVGFAGIGGNQATVTINGGTVLAQCLGGLGVGIGGNDARVAINGGVVTAQGMGNGLLGACDIGSYVAGCTVTIGGGSIDAFSIRGDIRISGGIFTIPIPDNWCADQFAPSGNADPATQGKYPHAVVPGWTVTIGSHPKTTAVWTSGNGVVSNAVEGSSFKVPDGSENVTVHFTAHSDYVLEGEATVALGTVTEDIVFGVGNEFAVPRGYCPLGDIPYLDWNGSQMTNAVLSKYDYALVTDATEEMTEGWYVVAQDIERDRIKVTGAVNLVLVDDRELSVSGTRDDVPGIDVSGSNRLTIYGQIKGTGQVTANGGERSAGIGGGAGGYVTINGGTVIAQSANAGAGIGGGSQAEGGIVAINGGTVTAMGGWGATGIGGGWGKGGGTATICGGAVTAKAGMQGESDISGTVSISGGIFGMEPQDAWLAEKRMVVPNPDEATQADYPWAVVPSYTVTIGTLSHLTAAWTSVSPERSESPSGDGCQGCDGSVTNVIDGAGFTVPEGTTNVRVIFTAHRGWEIVGDAVVELGTVTEDIVFGEESGFFVPRVQHAPVPYVDADGVARTKTADEFDVITEETRFLTNGWYAVIEDVDIAAKTNITVQGDVHLILCDGTSLVITNKSTVATVSVGDGASLTIYGQTNNTGRLEAKNGNSAAGIGGDKSGTCGAIAIHGGTVKAEGGTFSAGIGGGMLGGGGTVTITGGRVAATGHNNAADIGNAYGATTPCAVSISGGIFARAVQDAWLAPGFAAVANTDEMTMAEYPWAIVDRRVGVSPNNPLGPYATAVEATDAMSMAVFAPDEEVAEELTTQARARYERWFGLDVAERGASRWYVEAMLTDAAKSNLAETATAATRQIPVAAIAALADDATTNVTVTGCEPGFYYTLHDGAVLTDIVPDEDVVNRNVLCGADGKVEFPAVAKPSDAAGFFRVGVDVVRPERIVVFGIDGKLFSGEVDINAADGTAVSVWPTNVKPGLVYGLGRSKWPTGPFVVEEDGWVQADGNGTLPRAITAPKDDDAGRFFRIMVREDVPGEML